MIENQGGQSNINPGLSEKTSVWGCVRVGALFFCFQLWENFTVIDVTRQYLFC